MYLTSSAVALKQADKSRPKDKRRIIPALGQLIFFIALSPSGILCSITKDH
jgi:hypothetical protein